MKPIPSDLETTGGEPAGARDLFSPTAMPAIGQEERNGQEFSITP